MVGAAVLRHEINIANGHNLIDNIMNNVNNSNTSIIKQLKNDWDNLIN